MKPWVIGILTVGLGLGLVCGRPQADTGRSAPKKSGAASEEKSFDEIVDLSRVRKGNFEWDTQKLIADGFSALHREHMRLLDELNDVKERLEALEEGYSGEEP